MCRVNIERLFDIKHNDTVFRYGLGRQENRQFPHDSTLNFSLQPGRRRSYTPESWQRNICVSTRWFCLAPLATLGSYAPSIFTPSYLVISDGQLPVVHEASLKLSWPPFRRLTAQELCQVCFWVAKI